MAFTLHGKMQMQPQTLFSDNGVHIHILSVFNANLPAGLKITGIQCQLFDLSPYVLGFSEIV